jgi:hypothetical protein
MEDRLLRAGVPSGSSRFLREEVQDRGKQRVDKDCPKVQPDEFQDGQVDRTQDPLPQRFTEALCYS